MSTPRKTVLFDPDGPLMPLLDTAERFETYSSLPHVEWHKNVIRERLAEIVKKHRTACQEECAPHLKELIDLSKGDDMARWF